MKTPSKYILLIDPKAEILNLQEATLKCFYAEDVILAQSAQKAQESIEKRGVPEVIIMDYESLVEDDSRFYHFFESENIETPLIVFTEKPLDNKTNVFYPLVTAFLDKPNTAQSFTYITRNLVPLPIKQKAHIPVKISVLSRLGMGHFDLFLKLSETNYVKIIHKGEPFLDTDARKLINKSIHELYIRQEDGQEFLRFLEGEVPVESLDPVEDITKSIENLETFEEVGRAMGWSPAIMNAAQKSVTQAVKILSKNTSIIGTLKRRLRDPSSPYSRHIGLLSYLVCAFSSSLGWIGEAGQVKLAMAALIHDVAVDEAFYENIHEWNKRAADPSDKSPETIRYRMHPYEASKMMRSLDSFSPDVDQIILQHHEVRDGTGFPRGMAASRIGHLPALFIIVEDLVEFIDNGDNIETSVVDFITWGREHYDIGHFKKIFKGFEEKLKV